MGLVQLPGAGVAARASLSLIDRLWRLWSPSFRLDPHRADALRACLAESLPAPLAYYRAMLRPLRTAPTRLREASRPIVTPLLQLHGAEDGCVLPPNSDDARLFRERELDVRPGLGHFLAHEDPVGIAARVLAWLR
jgi:pimeloyl-ACP methyl ester carboxylesterase